MQTLPAPEVSLVSDRVDALIPYALLLSRLLVGVIFLWAGIDKAMAPGTFASIIRAYHLLPPSLEMPFAYTLPWIEILIGVYLLAGFMSKLAAAGAIALLAMFVVVLGYKLITGDTAHPCGCFGAGSQLNAVLAFVAGGESITWWDVIRDALLIVLCVPVLLYGPGEFSVERFLERRHGDMSTA